ncbi:cytochrome c-type biogenesis protein CycL [Luminiphilus syltensis NOR5-1B]|uniref:Cytochrome c-type biogenesis protein n=1 Tax=Luminiphilus syltensis NOR5-1B TaxID=565045 RepID=B8KS75_9GAMM|nr:cytochrome c-type biogenesis protein [Luminiphilus syltensis]EED35745.1 cytochrome c-type biogenesis protein CycL [Luminiphilus syltensis NOR5-1B]
MARLLAAILLACYPVWVAAVIETYQFSSDELEARYHSLSQELRCPKCQNQSIADSNAPISRDLRALLHRQLEAGSNDEEILDFMVERYGEFVRYRPAVDANTAPLWLAPPLLIALGGLGLIWHLRRQGAASETLSDAERERLRQQVDKEEQ